MTKGKERVKGGEEGISLCPHHRSDNEIGSKFKYRVQQQEKIVAAKPASGYLQCVDKTTLEGLLVMDIRVQRIFYVERFLVFQNMVINSSSNPKYFRETKVRAVLDGSGAV